MNSLMRQLIFAAIAVALIRPVPARGQTITQAELAGSWRTRGVMGVNWNPAKKEVSVRMYETLVMLHSNGTYQTDYTYVDELGVQKTGTAGFGGLESKGRWTLKSDTLIVSYLPSDTLSRDYEPARGIVSIRGDTMAIAWSAPRIKVKGVWTELKGAGVLPPDELERVDPSKQRAALTPPPATLKPAALAGTWVAKVDSLADTLTLRGDGTWTAREESISTVGKDTQGQPYATCEMVKPAEASHTGSWYLGPANTLILVDAKQRQVCSGGQRWRGGSAFKLQDQRLVAVNPSTTYDRVDP